MYVIVSLTLAERRREIRYIRALSHKSAYYVGLRRRPGVVPVA